MHEAIRSMMERYECRAQNDYTNALREILQQIVLLGLWRSKFFEHAAFYGGTALRILHGLDRYSEEIDFSLLKRDSQFSIGAYGCTGMVRSQASATPHRTSRKPHATIGRLHRQKPVDARGAGQPIESGVGPFGSGTGSSGGRPICPGFAKPGSLVQGFFSSHL